MHLLVPLKRWILVLPVMMLLSGCLYPNSSRTDIEIGGIDANNPQALEQFFESYEALLSNRGFIFGKSFAEFGSNVMYSELKGNLLTCRGAVVDGLVRIKCLENWSPWIPFLWPRVSTEYVQLMTNVAQFIEPFGATKIERYLYNSDYREMGLSELLEGH